MEVIAPGKWQLPYHIKLIGHFNSMTTAKYTDYICYLYVCLSVSLCVGKL